MLVTARPPLDIRLSLKKPKINPINNFLFYHRGREALISGLHALGIEPGSAIIVPAYICSSITIFLEDFGYKVVFLDVNKELQFDINNLKKAIKYENAKSVLVVHYFGFYSNILDIVQICKPLNVKVIEDCSHSFLSERNEKRVGLVGDISIFSLRKTLPCEDGGALCINNYSNTISITKEYNSKSFKISLYLVSRIVESIIAFIGWPNLYSSFINNIKIKLRTYAGSFVSKNQQFDLKSIHPSSPLVNYLTDKEYLSNIRNSSRKNYKQLLQAVIDLGLLPLYSDLDIGCVPQYFPLYDKKNIIVKLMREEGIGAIRWPWYELPEKVALSSSEFPIANELDRSLVLIPIHQGVKEKHLRKIILSLRECNV